MTDMTPNEADVHQERQLLMLGYKIAGALMRIVDADVTLDVDKGLNSRTDAVRITTPDHTVTVTPRLPGSAPPPTAGPAQSPT